MKPNPWNPQQNFSFGKGTKKVIFTAVVVSKWDTLDVRFSIVCVSGILEVYMKLFVTFRCEVLYSVLSHWDSLSRYHGCLNSVTASVCKRID